LAGDVRAVGENAKLGLSTCRPTTIFNVKRLLGRRLDDSQVQEFQALLKRGGYYNLTSDENQQLQIQVGSKKLYPEEVAAEIIAVAIKDTLDKFNDICLDRVVVSVPAHYNTLQREKTKIAALMAINKLRVKGYSERISIQNYSTDAPVDSIREISLISEPTAALITYLSKNHSYLKSNANIFVFDLGAGTLDITIGKAVPIINPITGEDQYSINVQLTHGNNFLGGRDMDDLLMNHIKATLNQIHYQNIDTVLADKKDEIETVKKRLSVRDSSKFVYDEDQEPITITQIELEKAINPVLEKIKIEIETALKIANFKKENIDTVILVGGPTKMPCIQRIISDMVREFNPPDDWDSMLCVSEGAARSGVFGGCGDKVGHVIDRPGFMYYAAVEMFENIFVPTTIISANTDTLPTRKEIELLVPKPTKNQKDVTIKIVSSEDREDRIINSIKISTPAEGAEVTKKIRHYWETFERTDEEQISYGLVRLDCQITEDGLLTKPAFSDLHSGVTIPYPDLPNKNLGLISLTPFQEYEENWGTYATNYFHDIDTEIMKVVKKAQIEYPQFTKMEIVALLFQSIPQDIPFNDLRRKAMESVSLSRGKNASPELINKWERIINQSSSDTATNRSNLINVIHAVNALGIE